VDLGFETIGNATLIVHDREPLLATDPWIEGSAYFGSWGLSHEVPAEQREAILAAPYLWFSHGHPDHLSADSLERLRGKTILLPDHVGGRIRHDLEAMGERVRVLPDRTWVSLSDRVRVLSFSDDYQDGVLLVDLAGSLVADLNDASDRGWHGFVRAQVRRFERSYLLALAGGGDTDMFHFFDEDGRPIAPAPQDPPGKKLAALARRFGARSVVPFSSMHRYQRRDSLWAADYTVRVEDFGRGFDGSAELLPAFVRMDLARNVASALDPPRAAARILEPEECGDRWSDPLEPDDVARLERAFRPLERLADGVRYVRFKVGGGEHTIDLGRRAPDRGVTFEAPRASLMKAVSGRFFDDLLIGNFVKTTLHGKWPATGLYPDFSPWIAKVADQGGARSRAEVARYLDAYRRRAPLEYLKHRFLERTRAVVTSRLRPGSAPHAAARRAYRLIKGE
jgi:L-ascorbate metabolism protein UlaG (beta-lactamase superfamily)